MASRTLDLPLSPGPIRQLMPAEGAQSMALIARKFRILKCLTRTMKAPFIIPVWLEYPTRCAKHPVTTADGSVPRLSSRWADWRSGRHRLSFCCKYGIWANIDIPVLGQVYRTCRGAVLYCPRAICEVREAAGFSQQRSFIVRVRNPRSLRYAQAAMRFSSRWESPGSRTARLIRRSVSAIAPIAAFQEQS